MMAGRDLDALHISCAARILPLTDGRPGLPTSDPLDKLHWAKLRLRLSPVAVDLFGPQTSPSACKFVRF